ncbi:LuxR C-terminal-related transcriptional regulator [Celeribacter indicus]|uniref:Transcriptional regulator, LuxR family protein n=1 Tax=Celeribacter indicus TaxID=1208324 RepID=A0A0B5E1W9_9RHOB|nr:LuxR C-terminal-related transcriptional regulator [Celeribacter indicus]AJE47046.1 transcriptional regulator, LuxR family protein [Celeribacter indicus]SDW92215.1 LuxR family transcriptional regulator, maltose regulon positive regulatory protein [Celeribacter indicus]
MDGVTSQPPRNALSLLHRSELEQRLLTGLDGQIVLLQAPAGYGKTEAMVSLYRSAERRGRDALWLTVTPDLRPDTLHARVASVLGLETQALPQILAAIQQRPAPVELYLDDAHRMSDSGLITGLLDYPPDQLRLVMASRDLPELRLSRLRMRGLLTVIGANELAFSHGEMHQLLRHWMTPEQMDRIIDTLAGWPALVRLALMECERGAPELELDALAEGQAGIYREFLDEEVFSSLAPMEWNVLRAVSGLESFTPRIAAELAGLSYDHHALRRIELMYPLVQPEEQNAGWFRLCPVVARALEFIAGSEPPETHRARHIRAAELFAESGIVEKSVLHASLAGDVHLAVNTIEKAGGVNLFLRAGYTVLRGIIRAVPHEAVLAVPSLRICRAVMLAKAGQIQQARTVLDLLIADTQAGKFPTNEAWVATLQHISSLNEIYEDKAMDAAGIERLRERADSQRQENTWQLAWIYNHLAICYTRTGDLEAAQSCAARALSLYQEERSTYPQAFMLIHLGFINYSANRPEAALDHLSQARKAINARHWSDANLLAIANVPLAAIRFLQGQIPEARRMLERDMPVMARGEGWVDFYVQGYAALARARFIEDGWACAQECLQDGLTQADARGLPRLRLSLSILRAELLTRDGQLDAAETTIRQWPQVTQPAAWPTPRERREALLAIGRVRLREGHVQAARDYLEVLALDAREARCWALLIRVSLLLAETRARQGDIDLALDALETAAELSRPGQQVQQYRDEGSDFAEVIRKLIRRSGLSRLSPTAAQYLSAAAAVHGRRARNHSLLSRREEEVLGLLAEGLSNKAIARRLDISEPTVKFHLKNLYSKLGVARRTLAVSVAQANGLLDQPPPSG